MITTKKTKNDPINDIIKEMTETSIPKGSRESHFREKYPEFTEKYPRLFLCAIDPSFPLFDGHFLKNMMAMKDMLIQDTVTVDAADKIIYDELRATYIDPVISNMSPQH